MKNAIESQLDAQHPWCGQIHWFDTLPSTNDLAKELAKKGAPHGTVLIAGHQSGGRGRMGRIFHSPEGMGLYLSVILRPNCAPDGLMHLTCAAAEAACDGVEKACGIRPGIKWINDLVIGKRKLGGILTELVLSPKGTLDSAVIGIGINCCQRAEDFPEDIRSIACSLAMAMENQPDRAKLAAAMIGSLHHMADQLFTGKEQMLDRYRQDCMTVGQDILVLRGDQRCYAKAIDIDDRGALVICLSDGTHETVNSGEVSIRGMYGYV